jgi:heme exporter protein B
MLEQARIVAMRDLVRERRAGEVAWVTVPFAAVALLLIPLAINTDTPLLRRIGPGLYWVVVLLFGVLTAVRRTAIETSAQRDAAALSGIDPAAGFAGKAAANILMLAGFEVVVGAVAIVLYDIDLVRWPWLLAVVPLAAIGLGLLGTLAASIAATAGAGAGLIPLLVAPLAVPLLLGATAALDSLRPSGGILAWVLLMVGVDAGLALAGVLSARPLAESR